jgi:erythrin-vacuolar iron transport family protein
MQFDVLERSSTEEARPMKDFEHLTEQEVLALAISAEEEDERFYADVAEALRQNFPASASVFDGMREEESGHRRRLIEMYQKKFGEHIPLIRRQEVKGFIARKSLWMLQPVNLDRIRKQVGVMELESGRFYRKAAVRSQDASIRQLLDDLAQEEQVHVTQAEDLENKKLTETVREQEAESQRRLFLLQIVQPGLAGLMDGSVSTLAPLFAAAVATHKSWDAFLVGLAASVGAGISMGFAEALSDDGSLTGRGHPWLRGGICGLMTALGGIGHTLPFLISSFHVAMTISAIVVAIELAVISWVRHKYMDMPPFTATVQVMFGGVLVFIAGVLIGSA